MDATGQTVDVYGVRDQPTATRHIRACLAAGFAPILLFAIGGGISAVLDEVGNVMFLRVRRGCPVVECTNTPAVWAKTLRKRADATIRVLLADPATPKWKMRWCRRSAEKQGAAAS